MTDDANGNGASTSSAAPTKYRFFRKVEPADGSGPTPVETRDLYELIQGEHGSLREAHTVGGDGEYVGVPLRSFNPTTVKSETTTKLVIG